MSASVFATLPLGTRIRQSAVAVLKSQGTLAGQNIQDSPLDPAAYDDAPIINVFSSERRDGRATAGGPPGFTAQYQLHLQCIVVAADKNDAVLQADTLKQQALDALFGDPIFPTLCNPASAIEEKRNTGQDNARFLIEHMITIVAGWFENFVPRGTSVLAGVAAPGVPTPTITAFTQANNTIIAGSAPGAGGAGTAPTEFGADVPLPPP
jgi:hypothetical protein